MNYMNGRFSRFGRVTLSSIRDAVKSSQSLDTEANGRRYPYNTKNINFTLSFCKGNFFIASVPTMWIQVRFSRDDSGPRPLHRDLKFPNFDHYRKDQFKDIRKTTWGLGDDKPGYTYVIGVLGLIFGAYGVKAQVIHYVSVMSTPADVLALAVVEVDITKIEPGACMTIKWRGKPLFIKSRTDAQIESEANTPLSSLRDPQTESERVKKPAWLIIIGVCTHLGCVPIPNSGDYVGGFYCPCHGSHYDNLGRTRKGPAPTNMVVPAYEFVSDSVIRVG